MAKNVWEFKHGISDDFILALNSEYEKGKGNWWYELLNANDLRKKRKAFFLAIRNQSINIYYKGNSIVKVTFDKNAIRCKTHYKYLLEPEGNVYIDSEQGKIKFGENISRFFQKDLTSPNSLIKASSPYAGPEKIGVHTIIQRNENIIDTEISFKRDDEKEHEEEIDYPEVGDMTSGQKKSKRNQIDFLAIHHEKGKGVLRFYEAKHFNNPEIRSKGEPEIIKQLGRYDKSLLQYKKNIIDGYKNVIGNLIKIKGIPKTKIQFLKQTLEMELKLDLNPTLIIFGFDDDQKKGGLIKIEANISKFDSNKHRIKALGNPNSFKLRGRI